MPHATRRRLTRAGDAEEQARRDAGEEARQFVGVIISMCCMNQLDGRWGQIVMVSTGIYSKALLARIGRGLSEIIARIIHWRLFSGRGIKWASRL